MTKHTPGPWRSQYSNDVGPYDDYFVEFFEVTSEDGTKIAQVEEEKDARLICAAPDLLEALQGFITWPAATNWNTEKARIAIAKAMGEA